MSTATADTRDYAVTVSGDTYRQVTQLARDTGLTRKQIADAALRAFLASSNDLVIIRKAPKSESAEQVV